jgi:hypothetical protein
MMQIDDYVTDDQALGSFISKLRKAVTQPIKFLAKESTKVATGVTRAVGIKPGTILGKAIIKPVSFGGKVAVKATNLAFKPVTAVGKVAQAIAKPVTEMGKPKKPVARTMTTAQPTPAQAAAAEAAMQSAYAPVAALPNSYGLTPGALSPTGSSFLDPASDFTPSGAPASPLSSLPPWALPAAAGVVVLLLLSKKKQ